MRAFLACFCTSIWKEGGWPHLSAATEGNHSSYLLFLLYIAIISSSTVVATSLWNKKTTLNLLMGKKTIKLVFPTPLYNGIRCYWRCQKYWEKEDPAWSFFSSTAHRMLGSHQPIQRLRIFRLRKPGEEYSLWWKLKGVSESTGHSKAVGLHCAL